MNAKELRIGNYAKDPYNKTIKLVSVEKDASMLTPIPLTEEWLIKFGFKENILYRGRKRFWLLDFNISRHKNKGCVVAYAGRAYKHIKHVHQLQNIYFAVTGEELTINK